MPQVPNELCHYASLHDLCMALDEDYSPQKARFEAALPFALKVDALHACGMCGCLRSLRFRVVVVVCRARRSKSISSSTPNLPAFLSIKGFTSSAGSGGMEIRLTPSGCSTERCCVCVPCSKELFAGLAMMMSGSCDDDVTYVYDDVTCQWRHELIWPFGRGLIHRSRLPCA